MKYIKNKYFLIISFILVVFIAIGLFLAASLNFVKNSDRAVFAYTIKVKDAYEKIDKIFERAELNVYLMSDSIANSYDETKQNDEKYNMNFIQEIDSLVKSVLINSPGVSGSWFQINADLPFSARAFNWYEFSGNQFQNMYNELEDSASTSRKVTPEDDPYYFDAIDKKGPTWSDVYEDADTKEKMLTVSSSIYKQNVLVGVVGIDLLVKDLQNIMEDMQSDLEYSEFFLLDKNGKLIVAQSFSNIGIVREPYGFSNLFKGKADEPVEYKDNFKTKTAIMISLSNGYKLVIATENKKLFNRTARILNISFVLISLVVLLIIAIFVYKIKVSDEDKKQENASPDDENEDVIADENEDSLADENEDYRHRVE